MAKMQSAKGSRAPVKKSVAPARNNGSNGKHAAPPRLDRGPDKVFAKPRGRVDDFSFNKEVTAVFDDMLDRSVPFYQEIQRMTAEMAVDFAQAGTNVYDLGCSTANSFLNIDRIMAPDANVRFVGVDESKDMLDKARAKLTAAKFARPFELEQGDLNA